MKQSRRVSKHFNQRKQNKINCTTFEGWKDTVGTGMLELQYYNVCQVQEVMTTNICCSQFILHNKILQTQTACSKYPTQ